MKEETFNINDSKDIEILAEQSEQNSQDSPLKIEVSGSSMSSIPHNLAKLKRKMTYDEWKVRKDTEEKLKQRLIENAKAEV